VILFSACNQENKKTDKKLVNNNSEHTPLYQDRKDTTPGIMNDTLYGNKNSVIVKKTKYLIIPPRITRLPFGPNISLNKLYTADKFYTRLIYDNAGELMNSGWTDKALRKIKIYKLPLIKKINYIKINSVDTDRCQNGKLLSGFLKLSKYRYRLPDVGVYQCYYWCDYNPNNNEYSSYVKQNCDRCLLNFFYGYLILYNPKTLEANVIAIYYDTFRDGSNLYRNFYIDKNYNITLLDSSQEADDGDGSNPSKVFVNNKHTVSISKQGDIRVK